ncbi:Transmembrane amino acid transporter protein [Trichomonas vaginalis G3]|uniref:Transmembrane amino acid transporter protein n=1 Tax=Trichomonas vaginalis (strain ATCC PRA-98 / G3) TaxID=412133 RepID=A2EEY9_TRIV3|nr:amino acid transmembrane transporter protein [Trichomonas vaginalis G3]EAY08787.1 Transmembrane amino acid transporter protein [Trichomonas vaginalis G3]KAI5515117.1 amino acid transmembrane transporter protein [Trichomonas vaginalis G3]|eukprot:XP_001321010.1 Transmembrane amino acid transporter protein [Trichomonas vaginalis G3]
MEDQHEPQVVQVEEETTLDSSNSYTTTEETKSDSSEKKNPENPDASLDNEKEDEEFERHRVGRFATVINLLNSLLGASIFSLPGKFKEIGIIPSVVLLAVAAYISYVCANILVRLQKEVKGTGLDDISLKIFGRVGQIIVSIISLVFCTSGVVAFIVIACDVIQQWFVLKGIKVTYMIRVAITFIYSILPVSLAIPRSLKFLSYFSSLTILIMLFYVLVVIIRSPKIIPHQNFKDPNFSIGKFGFGIFSALSVFFLNFTLPITTLPIIEKYNKDLKKRSIALEFTSVACFAILAIPGVLGYMMIFDVGTSELIFSYEKFQKDVLFNIVKGGCLIAVSCSYPIFVKPIVATWSQFFFRENDAYNLSIPKLAIAHAIAHIIPVCVAAFYPKVMTILDYCGSFGVLINITVPGLLYYMHFKPRLNSILFWWSWLIIIIGIFVAIATIIINVKSAITSH